MRAEVRERADDTQAELNEMHRDRFRNAAERSLDANLAMADTRALFRPVIGLMGGTALVLTLLVGVPFGLPISKHLPDSVEPIRSHLLTACAGVVVCD